MLKAAGFVFASGLLLISLNPQSNIFAGSKSVEAYEIRPGVLLIPSYSADGQLCEIGLQTRNYSPDVIRVHPSLLPKDIDDIFAKFVTADQRGAISAEPIGGTLVMEGGQAITTVTDYENVTISTYGAESTPSTGKTVITPNIVAVAHWKHRICK